MSNCSRGGNACNYKLARERQCRHQTKRNDNGTTRRRETRGDNEKEAKHTNKRPERRQATSLGPLVLTRTADDDDWTTMPVPATQQGGSRVLDAEPGDNDDRRTRTGTTTTTTGTGTGTTTKWAGTQGRQRRGRGYSNDAQDDPSTPPHRCELLLAWWIAGGR